MNRYSVIVLNKAKKEELGGRLRDLRQQIMFVFPPGRSRLSLEIDLINLLLSEGETVTVGDVPMRGGEIKLGAVWDTLAWCHSEVTCAEFLSICRGLAEISGS